MSMDNLASIYYGFAIEYDEVDQIPEDKIETYIDDSWYIGEHFGQGFYYHAWRSDTLILGVECYETDDITEITPYALSKVVNETTEALKEIYHELFPDRDIKEPRILLIQREF